MINSYRFYILDWAGVQREINPINREIFTISFLAGNYFDDEFTFSPNIELKGSELQIGYPDKDFFDEWFANRLHLRKMPLQIYNDSLGIVVSSFAETSLDMSYAKIEPDQIIVSIVQDKQSFAEQAQALNLQLIENDITRLRIQTVRSHVPDYVLGGTMLVALYTLIMQIVSYVNRGIQLAAIVPPQPAAITAYVVEGAILFAQFIAFYNQLGDAIFSKIRCYAAVNVKELLKKACNYLGYSLSTSLFSGKFENTTLLDIKSYKGSLISNNLPSTDYATPNMSLYDLMFEISKIFNAKAKINGNTIQFEHISYFLQPSGLKLPHVKDSENREYPIMKNAFELKKNFLFQFKTDPIETNTITKREGYIAQTQFSRDDLKGLIRKEINFAQALRKESTTILETIFNAIYDIISSVTSLTQITFNDRNNCLLLSQEAIGVPKLFLWKDEKIDSYNLDYLNADFIRNQYENLFPTNAQYELIENYECDLSKDEILLLLQNPVCQWWDGRVAIIDKEVELLDNGLVRLSVRVYDQYLQTTDFVRTDISY